MYNNTEDRYNNTEDRYNHTTRMAQSKRGSI
jgi:hypothetical protein